jgi:hypothetical protein
MTIRRLTNEDAIAWKDVLRVLMPHCSPPASGSSEETCLQAMSRVLAERRKMDPIFLRPEWLHDELLGGLVAETHEQEAQRTEREAWYNSQPGPIGRRLGSSVRLMRWMSNKLNMELKPQVNVSIVSYDTGGNHNPMHFDNPDTFGELNLLICLERIRSSEQAGTRTLFVLEDGIKSSDLNAGDAVIFDSAYTLHGRTPLVDGEKVTLMTLGFSPAY